MALFVLFFCVFRLVYFLDVSHTSVEAISWWNMPIVVGWHTSMAMENVLVADLTSSNSDWMP